MKRIKLALAPGTTWDWNSGVSLRGLLFGKPLRFYVCIAAISNRQVYLEN